jgi:hypothetical protein
VGVLPDVLAGEDEILAHCLLQPRVELVTGARLQRSGDFGGAGEQRGQDSAFWNKFEPL